jgi:hypothetical protein
MLFQGSGQQGAAVYISRPSRRGWGVGGEAGLEGEGRVEFGGSQRWPARGPMVLSKREGGKEKGSKRGSAHARGRGQELGPTHSASAAPRRVTQAARARRGARVCSLRYRRALSILVLRWRAFHHRSQRSASWSQPGLTGLFQFGLTPGSRSTSQARRVPGPMPSHTGSHTHHITMFSSPSRRVLSRSGCARGTAADPGMRPAICTALRQLQPALLRGSSPYPRGIPAGAGLCYLQPSFLGAEIPH